MSRRLYHNVYGVRKPDIIANDVTLDHQRNTQSAKAHPAGVLIRRR
jgi:hypothetical protein